MKIIELKLQELQQKLNDGFYSRMERIKERISELDNKSAGFIQPEQRKNRLTIK